MRQAKLLQPEAGCQLTLIDQGSKAILGTAFLRKAPISWLLLASRPLCLCGEIHLRAPFLRASLGFAPLDGISYESQQGGSDLRGYRFGSSRCRRAPITLE